MSCMSRQIAVTAIPGANVFPLAGPALVFVSPSADDASPTLVPPTASTRPM